MISGRILLGVLENENRVTKWPMSTRTFGRLFDGHPLAFVGGWVEEDDVSRGMLIEGAEVPGGIPDGFHYSGRKTQALS